MTAAMVAACLALPATVYPLIQLLDSMQGTKKGLTVTGTVLSDYIKAETICGHPAGHVWS